MKRVYKLTPVREYDIAGVESWLEDMARRGLYLKKFRPLFCTFERGKPGAARYRLEPHRRILDDDLPQSMLELYGQFGWDCVDEVNRAMLIFTTCNPDAPEIHTDPKLQEAQWRRLYRSSRNSFVLDLLLALVLFVFIGYLLLGTGTPVLNLVEQSILPLALLELWCLAQLMVSIPDLYLLSAAVRQLKEGVPLEHRTVYPRRRPWTVPSFLISLAVLLILIVGHYILPFTGGGMLPLEGVRDFTPLSLASLEGPDYQPDSFEAGGVDYANFSRQEHTLLCWHQWEVVESGKWSEDGRWIRLEIQWYDLALPFLARPLAQEQLRAAARLDDDIWWAAPEDETHTWTITQYPDRGLDYLAVAREESGWFQIAAAAQDGRTAVVRYTGRGNLADHLEEIAAMVTDQTAS